VKRLAFVVSLWAGLALADIAPPPPAEPTPAATPTPAPAPAPAVHPQGIEKAAPLGVIQGGWGYVYACYGLAIGGTILYAISLFTRRPRGNEGVPP
jgi:hypothetical protein